MHTSHLHFRQSFITLQRGLGAIAAPTCFFSQKRAQRIMMLLCCCFHQFIKSSIVFLRCYDIICCCCYSNQRGSKANTTVSRRGILGIWYENLLREKYIKLSNFRKQMLKCEN